MSKFRAFYTGLYVIELAMFSHGRIATYRLNRTVKYSWRRNIVSTECTDVCPLYAV